MATYQSIRYNVDYGGKAGALMPLLLFTSDGSDDTASFTTKIDSTYDTYLFIFNNIHPEADEADFEFNGSVDSGSNYNVTKTTTIFNTAHNEADNDARLSYETGRDLAQSTAFQPISINQGGMADNCTAGFLYLFNPSSTTFIKHFLARTAHTMRETFPGQTDNFTSGYFNTTSAIDAVQFKFASDEIQAGTIGMFGVI